MDVSNAAVTNRCYRNTLVITLIAVFFFSSAFWAAAEVSFSAIRASQDNRILFNAETEAPGYGEYHTSFLADLSDKSLQQLTVFPERISLIANSQAIRIQNRFGLFRLDPDSGWFSREIPFPSFQHGDAIQSGKIRPVTSSPNGRFLVYLEQISPAYARLVMYDTVREQQEIITENMALTYDPPPVSWSPDSSMLIYSTQGELFYFSLQQYRNGRIPDQAVRRIGPGAIHNVQWGRFGSMYYVRGSLVYKILPNELFTRTLYQGIMSIGTMAGKLPFSFDPNFDRFHIAPDGQKLLFTKSERTVFLLFLRGDDYVSTGQTVSLPYLYLPRNSRVEQIVWSIDDLVSIITSSNRNGSPQYSLFRLDPAETGDASLQFSRLEQEGVRSMDLDSSHERVLLRTGAGIEIRRYRDWSLIQRHEHEDVQHALWLNPDEVLVAGSRIYEKVDVRTGEAQWAGFSSVHRSGFSMESDQPVITSGSTTRLLQEAGRWTAAEEAERADPVQITRDYRVFLENQSEGAPYRNLVLMRDAHGVGTERLFELPERRYEAFPEFDDPVDNRVFSHGSRIRRRELSLVFNAVDSVEGLSHILAVLRDYDIKATFFINGQFIDRNPQAAREIIESGHEAGNLFHAYFDMTDSRFRMTEDYIQQGLSKNEDDFFAATGHELSLIWHAPYYYVGSQILDAAEELGYAYIGRDVDALDWVPKRAQDSAAGLYRPSAELVERIVDEKQPGSIIAMRVGIPGEDQLNEGRDDYLFQHLEVLVNELLERGYSFVPVSALRDRVQ